MARTIDKSDGEGQPRPSVPLVTAAGAVAGKLGEDAKQAQVGPKWDVAG